MLVADVSLASVLSTDNDIHRVIEVVSETSPACPVTTLHGKFVRLLYSNIGFLHILLQFKVLLVNSLKPRNRLNHADAIPA